jgi:ABC-type multidrug transport system ATPase subunit
MTPGLALEVDALTKFYGKRKAVDAVTFGVAAGEILGILGPDGAGKTTLLQMLAGVVAPTSGSRHFASSTAPRIGFMSAGFSLYPTLSVDENVDFFAAIERVPRDARKSRKAELLAFSRLDVARDRQAQFLSGGMQKKLALACALIHEPDYLFLDEPTTGVDPVSRRDFWQILERFTRSGMTIVVSTPYMDEAERFSRVAFLSEGRILAIDTPAALRGQRSLESAFIDILSRQPAQAVPERPVEVRQVGSSDRVAVRVDRVVKRFGAVAALRGISFEVRRGEIFGLLGPNGAGKSTLIRILTGISAPTSGNTLIDGSSVVANPYAVKASVGYMAQRFSLYRDLTVEENVDLSSGLYALDAATARTRRDEALRFSGLTEHARMRTRDLSGGWLQRLAFECAFVHRPPIVFLDEPTSGVDPISRRRFWRTIAALAQAGTTVFVTTHYMDEAEHCTRIAFLYEGEIVAIGTPQELKRDVLQNALAAPTLEDVFVALLEGRRAA